MGPSRRFPLVCLCLLLAAVQAAQAARFWEWCHFRQDVHVELERVMEEHVFGQHIARVSIPAQLRAHIERSVVMDPKMSNSAHALAMSFHGSTGVGKNFVGNFVAQNLFKKGVFHGHRFSGHEFIGNHGQDKYAHYVQDTVRKQLKHCPYSLFIFSDVHLMPSAVLDALVPFMQHGASNVNGVDYTKAVFIFESNYCASEINGRLRTLLQIQPREEISREDMTGVLRQCLQSTSGDAWSRGKLLEKELVHFVPFLALERQHARQCAGAILQNVRDLGVDLRKWKHLTWDTQIESFLADQMPRVGPFMKSGCKLIEQEAVNPIILYGLSLANPQDMPCGIFASTKCYRHRKHDIHISRCHTDNPPIVVHARHTSSTRVVSTRLSPDCEGGSVSSPTDRQSATDSGATQRIRDL